MQGTKFQAICLENIRRRPKAAVPKRDNRLWSKMPHLRPVQWTAAFRYRSSPDPIENFCQLLSLIAIKDETYSKETADFASKPG